MQNIDRDGGGRRVKTEAGIDGLDIQYGEHISLLSSLFSMCDQMFEPLWRTQMSRAAHR